MPDPHDPMKALEEWLAGRSAPGAVLSSATTSSVASAATSPAVPIVAADPSATVAAAPSKKIEKKKIQLLFRAARATVEKETDPGKPDYKNMDESVIDPAKGFVGALDGLGSTENGASQFVALLLKEGLGKIPEQLSENKMRVAVESLVQDINKKLIAENTAKSSNSQTTLVFSKAFKNEKGENKLIVVNIGDSRLSLIHKGEIRFQTLDQKSYDPNVFGGDHTEREKIYWGNWEKIVEKVKTIKKTSNDGAAILILNIAQAIANNIDTLKDPSTLDVAEMAVVVKELAGVGLGKDDLGNNESGFYPIIQMCSERNIGVSQTMGTPGIVPNIDILDLEPGDLVLTYSDGVTGNFTDKELLEIARANKPTEVPAIIKQIMEERISGKSSTVYARTKKDDVTLAVLSIERELINKITFTNKDLLEVLNFWKNINTPFTTGSISQNLGVAFNLASEMLSRVLMVGIDGLPPIVTAENKIDADAVDDFERYITTHNMLDKVFVLPPPYETVLLTGDLMDFVMEKAETIKNKKRFGTFKDGEDLLTAEDIQKKFNISLEHAKIIIADLVGAKALVNNQLADFNLIEKLKADVERAGRDFNMLDPKVINPAPATSTPSSGATTATGTRPDAGASTAPATPAVVPGATIEKGDSSGMWGSLKNLAQEIWKNKTKRRLAIITLVTSAAFTGAKLYESKNEVHPENKGQDITAPSQEDPNKSIKTSEVSGKTKGFTPLESLNPNFENTRWWKELDPKIQTNIKWLLGANDAQTYFLKFFENVEVLNESKKIELNHDEQIFLYTKLIQNQSPNLLMEAYSKNEQIQQSCLVNLRNTMCYVREGLATAVDESKKIFIATDPQNAQEDLKLVLEPKSLQDIFKELQERMKTIIKANTGQ